MMVHWIKQYEEEYGEGKDETGMTRGCKLSAQAANNFRVSSNLL